MQYYDVIYDLTDAVKAAMAGELGPLIVETVVGRAEVREVFSAGKHGKAAGLLVTEGYIRKALKARIMRDDVIIYNGSIASLRRFKDDVAEVRAGLECGVTFENTTDIKAGDFVETYEVEERERTLVRRGRDRCGEHSSTSDLPAPPAAETLGWELIHEDPEAGTIEIAFHPGEAFLNPHGTVQGGFVAAMLDDTMGPALVSKNDGACVPAHDRDERQLRARGEARPGDRQGPGRQPGQDHRLPRRRVVRHGGQSPRPRDVERADREYRLMARHNETPEGRSVRLLRVGEQVRHALVRYPDARRRP